MNSGFDMEIKVPSQTRFLAVVGRIAEDLVQQLKSYQGNREELAHQLNIVLTEAMANAIKHANRADPDKKVLIRINVENNEIIIRVFDSGSGFDLDSIANPDFENQPLDERGRGIFIIRSLMDLVEYRQADNGYVLEMRKRL